MAGLLLISPEVGVDVWGDNDLGFLGIFFVELMTFPRILAALIGVTLWTSVVLTLRFLETEMTAEPSSGRERLLSRPGVACRWIGVRGVLFSDTVILTVFLPARGDSVMGVLAFIRTDVVMDLATAIDVLSGVLNVSVLDFFIKGVTVVDGVLNDLIFELLLTSLSFGLACFSLVLFFKLKLVVFPVTEDGVFSLETFIIITSDDSCFTLLAVLRDFRMMGETTELGLMDFGLRGFWDLSLTFSVDIVAFSNLASLSELLAVNLTDSLCLLGVLFLLGDTDIIFLLFVSLLLLIFSLVSFAAEVFSLELADEAAFLFC